MLRSLRSFKLTNKDLPVRPGFGTEGREVKLRTNFFAVKVPKGPLYEYDIKIKPEPATKGLRRNIFELAEATPGWANAGLTGRVAHDYASMLVSASKLPLPLQIRVTLSEGAEPPAEPQPTQPKRGGRRGRGKKTAAPRNEYTLSFHFVHELETQSLVKYVIVQHLSIHVQKLAMYEGASAHSLAR